MTKIATDIHLYTTNTPNGVKVSMLLEELNLEYKVTRIDIMAGGSKEPWFLEINPNGRIPALTDTFTDGKSIRLFESASIMQYLVERYDTEHKLSYPRDSPIHMCYPSSGGDYETDFGVQVFWQMAGLGPMQGQANHFVRYAPEKIEYGINRYMNESRRLYRVLDGHLAKSTSGFMVGDKCTIADFVMIGWVGTSNWIGLNIDEFPKVKEWLERMEKRPAVVAGWNVPTPRTDLNLTQKEAKERGEWIQKTMAEDAKKAA
ncbi:Disulfide-bond oxidoreductase YfcG [Ceratocystis platani]|uniref:Disulfide-bond oxidoreductase YfcG n=1 Tax=Ceratocystis fimbriata f. sp. platani TaxID=88771 RepID=A0A0F8CQR7_CERFI|nr:Disulfide-bond oxidoreductase YfcG [Ceratocystis platani]